MAGINKWRTLKEVHAGHGLIGPNAILQLLPILDVTVGPRGTEMLLQRAEAQRPNGDEMIPEEQAARFHHAIRDMLPNLAADLAAKSGAATADYILAHRIPATAQAVLRILPPRLAARALSRAITAHAWTFAGSGSFKAETPWSFEIENNPLIAGEHSETPLCLWHAAVFGRLYQKLVDSRVNCREITCAAQDGHTCCSFELFR